MGYLKRFVGCLKKNPGRIKGDLLETGRALRLRVTFGLERGKGSERESFRGSEKILQGLKKCLDRSESAIEHGQNTGLKRHRRGERTILEFQRQVQI